MVGLSRKLLTCSTILCANYIGGVDVVDSVSLKGEHFEGVDAVVHTVGIIQERQPNQTFRKVHVVGTRNVVEKASVSSVPKFVYISAIGADENAQAEYSQTKAMAEQMVIGGGLNYTILRPSIILGKDGEFVAQMQDLVRSGGLPIKLPFPFIPVPGSGNNLFQPVFVDDLTACIVKAVGPMVAAYETIDVGGQIR